MIYKTFLLLLFPIILFSQNKSYKVIGVKDGDTVEILMDGKPQVVRLSHIDCPEKKQPFGNNAKQFASDLCFGKKVKLSTGWKKDRNKRLLAEIILSNGKNLNKELVKNGFAWHYKKYSKDNSYDDLEKQARKQKLGLWTDKSPTAPWEWRKSRKKSSKPTLSTIAKSK
ncbi:thermonuclease family protein [Chryseobacterium sp. Ch-15]|uniref:Thermonuclease family protein n=1 Tax=Chryseobacterium muglaense TaxID=2893752 RepID=A0A9Q3UPL5_9FLAO|nr:thermonuclease family protein [Chryseobacterium muglaense]MBD3904020.1 thermonuclease family protein [Chryseobacterium muglaense]MCC9032794.1 thermonuclease family protein [Chryseobacterium muglaense]MCM2553669.1 thermonuclease family protein [Chryseobacterium muglaense]